MTEALDELFTTAPEIAVAEQPEPLLALRGKPLLVTGASGLVGTHACRELARRGWTVRALVRDPVRAATRLVPAPAELRVGDLRDPAVLREAVSGVGAVVHLAAVAGERRSETYEIVNADATAALVRAAREADAERFVFMSMNGVSPDSPSRFVRSKATAEEAVRAGGIPWTILRPSIIFGPEDVFANVLARIVRLMPWVLPLPRGGAVRFQPVAVADVARVIGDVLDRTDSIGATYAIGGHLPLTLEQIMERVLLAMDVRRFIVGMPSVILRRIAAVVQRVLPNPPVTTTHFEILSMDNTVPHNDLRAVFGVVPAPFAPEELMYLRDISTRDAFRSLFRPDR